QIVIPKVVRDYLGIKPGDTVVLEVREGEVALVPGVDPKGFVEDFCSIVKEKLTRKVDLERLLESEVEEKLGLR
ncbi:MAG: AbrB family transcriptional regulator, partial [Desulfurococcales archaeon ex4484_217_2]